MLWFFKSLSDVYYQVLLHFNIDISLFTDYEQLVVVLLCNILSLFTFFVCFYIFYKFICRFLTFLNNI